MKMTPYEKMNKKAQKEQNKAKRAAVGFNTGTRVHDSKKRKNTREKVKNYDE